LPEFQSGDLARPQVLSLAQKGAGMQAPPPPRSTAGAARTLLASAEELLHDDERHDGEEDAQSGDADRVSFRSDGGDARFQSVARLRESLGSLGLDRHDDNGEEEGQAELDRFHVVVVVVVVVMNREEPGFPREGPKRRNRARGNSFGSEEEFAKREDGENRKPSSADNKPDVYGRGE